MELIETKIVSMVLLGSLSIVLGMIPIAIVKRLRWGSSGGQAMSWSTQALISGLLCFGGGVLMGTGLVHMLPEVHEGFEQVKKLRQMHTDLPLGLIVVCAGFFLVYLVEEIVHLISDRHAHNQTDVSLHRAVSIRGCTVSREGPAAPCSSSSAAISEQVECRQNSICELNCSDQEFCRDVSSAAGTDNAVCSHASNDQLVSSGAHEDERVTQVIIHAKGPSAANDCYGTFRPISDDSQHERAPECGTNHSCQQKW